MIFKIIEKIANTQFLNGVISRLMIYAILANLFLEILVWTTSGYSFFWAFWVSSGLGALFIAITFFVGIFIGFKAAFILLLTYIGFYMAVITLAGILVFTIVKYT